VIFKPELVELIVAGRKTQTRRPDRGVPCRYLPGREYAVQPGRGMRQVARIAVEAVWSTTPAHITTHEAHAEGFDSIGEFLAYWDRLYPGSDFGERVWAIQFRLVSTRGDV